MERKGLSQILYLIIAASVLMMIAMVITFTATDTIGGLGGQAEDSACADALTAQCSATSAQYVSVPSTCVTEGQYVDGRLESSVYPSADGSGSAINPGELSTPGTTGYTSCGPF